MSRCRRELKSQKELIRIQILLHTIFARFISEKMTTMPRYE